jgi:hypothetical protein
LKTGTGNSGYLDPHCIIKTTVVDNKYILIFFFAELD